MPDVNNLVNNAVSHSFEGPQVIDAIENAYYLCSSLYGSEFPLTSGTVGTDVIVIANIDHANAIALLATSILLESMLVKQKRNDPTVVIRTNDELITPEIRDMLLTADEADEDQVSEGVMWDDSGPTEPWEVF